jgi:DNA-binding transcriptional MerR regulator
MLYLKYSNFGWSSNFLAFKINIPPMPRTKEVLTKRYYTISEVAEMFEVSNSLIRFWDQEFDILKPHKTRKGDRRFTPENIKQFETIYHLVKEKEFTLNGARKEIHRKKKYQRKKLEMLQKMKKLKGFLKSLKTEL